MKKKISLELEIQEIILKNLVRPLKKFKIRKNGTYGLERKNLLHLSCKYSKLRLVKYCIETLKIDIKLKTRNKNTVLHYACVKGNFSVVKYLCEKDPSLINSFNKKQEWPLYVAAKNHHEKICIYLLNQGCLISATAKNGWNVAHWASAFAMNRLLKILNRNFFDFSKQNKKNENCLHFAAWSGNIECFEFILQFVKFNSKSYRGNVFYYLKGNWELLSHIIRRNYSKHIDLKLEILNINTPLEIFKQCKVSFELGDVLNYDRNDLLNELYLNKEITIEKLEKVTAYYKNNIQNCLNWIKSVKNWEKIKALLFLYHKKITKYSDIPICLLKEIYKFF